MKIRLMGSPDLIRAWGAELHRAYGVAGREYPCRGSHEIRLYLDLDDREAAKIVGLSNTDDFRNKGSFLKKKIKGS